MQIFKSTTFRIASLVKNSFVYIWSSCEVFLLVFILLYVFFDSYWLVFCILFGLLAKLYNLEDFFVFHPEEPPESRFYVELPSKYDLPYESLDIITKDKVRIHAYLLKQRDTVFNTAPTLICFHGNAGNIGQRIMQAKYFYNYCEFNVLLVEYRGYGLSEGAVSEKGFYMDAEAAMDYTFSRNDIDKNKIMLFGQSIGGAVAIDAAFNCKYNLYALVVENTFTTLPDIARELFSSVPGFGLFPDFCSKNQFRSLDKIKHLQVPCLFISGLADTLVPPRMMAKLYEKCNSSFKRMARIENGDHNGTWTLQGYFQSINKFIYELSTYRRQPNTINSQVWNL